MIMEQHRNINYSNKFYSISNTIYTEFDPAYVCMEL